MTMYIPASEAKKDVIVENHFSGALYKERQDNISAVQSFYKGEKSSAELIQKLNHALARADERLKEQEERIESLESLLMTDELTGLYNRRGFSNIFLKEIARTKRDPENAGLVLLISLENAEKIKAHCGPLAFEKAVKLLSQVLSEETRAMDSLGRLNESLLAALFSKTKSGQCLDRIQTLGKILNSLSIAWEGSEIPLFVSLSLKEFRAGDNGEKLMERLIEN